MLMRGCAVLFAVMFGLAGCAPQAPRMVVAPPAPPPVVAAVPVPVLAPASRVERFRQVSIVLYQPDAVLKARLGDDAAPLAAYIQRLDRRAAAVLEAAPVEPGFSAALVIALKPGGASRAWLVSKAKIPRELRDGLTAAAQDVTPLTVQAGPVAFAIIFDGFGGGGKPVVDKAHPIPIPPEWRDKVPQSPVPQGPGPAPLSQ